MAAEVRPDEKLENPQDILQGHEPGASRNSILLASDSYEEIVNCLDEQVVVQARERLPSGPICEIREIDLKKDIPVPDVKSLSLGEGSTKLGGQDKPTVTLDETEKRARTGGVSHENQYDSPPEVNGPTPSDIDNDSLSLENNQHGTHNKEASENTVSAQDLAAPPCDDQSVKAAKGTDAMGNTASNNSAPENKEADPAQAGAQSNASRAAPLTPPLSPIDEELDYVHSAKWRQHKKHVFILSEAGKPIYSRYGAEDRLVTMMGVMQALVSVIQHEKDSLRCIIAGQHKCVFLVRDHLMLVAVAASQESVPQLILQLTYIYNQVLSVLTLSQLSRIFKQRHNYDLRRLLTGAEKFFDSLLNLMDRDPCFMLGAVRCLPLESSVRDTVAQSIAQHAKVKDLVFAILLADNQLVTLVRMKKYFLHPLDLHLIFNLVSASESFKAAESWTPICLPKFDSSGYLHAHISYLDEACHICLLLLTVDRDVFFTLSECKHKIQEKLVKHHCLRTIAESISKKNYRSGDVGIQDLRHFVYKSRSTAQFTSPEFESPYASEEEQLRVFGLYQYLHQRIHNVSVPLKILFHVGTYETLLGWVTSGFELYAVFGPLVTKNVAINSVNKLLKWIKKEEDRLFIMSSPTF